MESNNRTIIRPIPGGRRADIPRPPPSPVEPQFTTSPPQGLGHLNPLESAASGLLALLARLKISRAHADPDGLKNRITGQIGEFQQTAQTQGIDQETVYTARYVLCTVLDEAVLSTPWGNNSSWAQQSLLSSFHKEVYGGERFFHLLKSLGQNPAKNRNLLELMYLCLALGFEGRYRIMEGGKDKLATIREWLYQIIQKERGFSEHALSPHWQGVTDRRNPLMRFVPAWVFGAVAAALLAALFAGFLFHLNRISDPVFKQVYTIKPPRIEADTAEPPVVLPPRLITLSILLADEINRNQVKVQESEHQSNVTIQGDGLFRSASASINQSVIPLLHRIGESLNQLSGKVLVIGHTDSQPIRSARYPSNWHLSQARAEAVASVIKQDLDDPSRVVAEGRSDLEPVASNKTREGRAKNRRVNILLLQ